MSQTNKFTKKIKLAVTNVDTGSIEFEEGLDFN